MKFRLLEYFEDDDFEDEYPKEDVVEYIYNAINTEDILDLIGAQLQPHIKADTPMFITPKGRFVYADQITRDSGLTHLEHLQHWNIADIFLNGVMNMAIEDNPSLADHINKYRMAYITDSTYQNELFTSLTDELGWARINCGITASDSRFYAVLPNKMTSGMLDALYEWLEWGYLNNRKEVLLYSDDNGDNSHIYSFREYAPEDIVKKIQRFYASGTFYEHKQGTIDEDYLDDNEEFYDYNTDPVTDHILFDTKTTGVTGYDNYMENPQWAEQEKNIKTRIAQITPQKYFEVCGEFFGNSAQTQIDQIRRETTILDKLYKVITQYKVKFPLGYLNFTNQMQEGRHRMYVAGELSGWETPQPVLIVEWADEEKANQERIAEIEHTISNKVVDRLRNRYYDSIEEFKEKLDSEMNYWFNEPKYTLEDYDDYFLLCYNGAEVELNKSDFNIYIEEDDIDFTDSKWKDWELNDEDIINDISIDDLESLSDEELQDKIDKLVPKNPWEKS